MNDDQARLLSYIAVKIAKIDAQVTVMLNTLACCHLAPDHQVEEELRKTARVQGMLEAAVREHARKTTESVDWLCREFPDLAPTFRDMKIRPEEPPDRENN